MIYNRCILSSLIVICLSSASWASSQGQEELLQQSLRPTAHEFLDKMAPMPATNPFWGNQPRPVETYDVYVSRWLPTLAEFIAEIEYVFPGGTWAPIGRDYVMLGDAMDAFYTSIGQPGRVKRINVSRGSFTHRPQDTIDFLKTFGLNFDPHASPPPVIAMDYTTYGKTSQSSLLMAAAYAEFKNRGGDLKKFLHRFNIINLGNTNTYSGCRRLDPKQILKEQEEDVDLLLRPPRPLPLTLGSCLTTNEWHNTWGPFTRLANGEVVTFPTLDHASAHRNVLGELFEMNKAVSSPEFLHRVQAACRKLGFEFPLPPAKRCQEKFTPAVVAH